MLGVVIQIDAREAGTGVAVPLRAASHDDAAVCHLTSDLAWPVISKLPKLGYDLFDGAFEGRIATPSASMSIGIEPWPTFAKLAIADTRFRLWTGEAGAPFAAWTQRVDARVTQQPAIADGRAELTFAVDDRWLDRALLATYAGTTGAEGPATLKGQAKPLALGAPRYVPGVLVDPVTSLFQVSGHGAIVAIDAALERLLRYGPPVQDYATLAELLAAAIPAGRWATALSGGWARFGAPPTGQVCFMVRGDAGGPNGWSRLPGQQIRRLALLSGGGGRIADASLNALDAARPYNLSLYLDQQTTARELIQEIAASVNAVAGVSWMGRLFVQPVAIGAPALTLAADGSALPPVDKVKQLEISPPFGKLAITAERTWSVHQLSDIAFTATLIDMGAWDAGTTYREGNIVQQQGSTWVYINPAPSAGNAPPQLPTVSNAYWRVLAKAGAAGQDGTSAFTLTGGSAIRIEGGSATRVDDQNGWAGVATFRAIERYTNGASLTFYAGDTSGPYYDFGLWRSDRYDADGNGGIHADYTWHVTPNGNVNDLQAFAGNDILGTYGQIAGQILGIYYDNNTVYWTVNGNIVLSRQIGAGASFYPRGAIHNSGSAVARIGWSKAGSVGADGKSAPLIRVQWSIDGLSNWHDNYFGADAYQRQSNDNGATWGPAYRIVGESGTVGQDGSFASFVFKRSATVPAAPGDNSGNPPAGWSDNPPDGTDFLWQSKATFRGATQLTSWSPPQRISGEAGVSPISVSLQPNAATFQVYANGSPYPGQFPYNVGATATQAGSIIPVTGIAIVSVDGLTMALNPLRITGVSKTDAYAVIDVSAAGQTQRVQISATLQRDGSDGSSATRISINAPQLAWTGYTQHGNSIGINASATGKISVNLTGLMTGDPNADYVLRFVSKLQYRVAGGAWTDVGGSEATSTEGGTTTVGDGGPVRIVRASVNGTGPYTITGLTADAAYEVRALTYRISNYGSSSVGLSLYAERVA